MRVRVSSHSPSTLMRNGRLERSASWTAPSPIFGAETLSLLAHVLDEMRTVDAFGEPREILDFGGERKLSSGVVSGDDDRLQVGAGSVDGSRVSGTPGADNGDV